MHAGKLARRALYFVLIVLAGCGQSVSVPAILTDSIALPRGIFTFPESIADGVSASGCSVSDDGLIWYGVPAGAFAPIDARYTNCAGAANLARGNLPAIPSWARRFAGSQTLFVATSLQDELLTPGMMAIESAASAAQLPVTWLVQNSQWISTDAALYNRYHAANGDDVQVQYSPGLLALAHANFPWFTPSVSAEGAGGSRNVAAAVQAGAPAFWGITWNSSGIDATEDRGAPWGTYCADPTSYKRPSPDGSCGLVSFEWTARDLTRAYFSGQEAAFSTDPDDVQLRAFFSPTDGARYAEALVDAYASAGTTQPIVMMSQQESHEQVDDAPGDGAILSALYQRVRSDGLVSTTLAKALPLATQFSAAPRAIAFPYIPGGGLSTYHLGEPYTPATIDYHDAVAGMTFVAGHTVPSRVFPYALETTSVYDVPLQTLADAATPALQRVAVQAGSLVFHFSAPNAAHYGVAIWADPTTLGADPTSVVFAGHAGFVAAFDLPAGESDRTVRCGTCTSAQFAYST